MNLIALHVGQQARISIPQHLAIVPSVGNWRYIAIALKTPR
jgi:hypothetical protein